MTKKSKQRQEELQRQRNDYTRPDEFEILKKKKLETLYTKKQRDRCNISNDTNYLKGEVYRYDNDAVV